MDKKETSKNTQPANQKVAHTKHRERMRQKFLNSPSSLADHEIIEMLLYNVFKQGNTNLQAHQLYTLSNNSLRNFLNLEQSQINSVERLGSSSVVFIKLLKEFYIRLEKEKLDLRNQNQITRKNIQTRLHKLFFGLDTEQLIMLCVDKNCRLIKEHIITHGISSAAVIPLKTIVKTALDDNASYVFLAHNHPNGVLAPSKSDIEATKTICEALSFVEIPVIEHYIVTENSILGIIGENPDKTSI